MLMVQECKDDRERKAKTTDEKNPKKNNSITYLNPYVSWLVNIVVQLWSIESYIEANGWKSGFGKHNIFDLLSLRLLIWFPTDKRLWKFMSQEQHKITHRYYMFTLL